MLQDGVVEWKVYQQILQEKVKRIRQEELQRQRQIVMSFVQMHFPDLVSLASKRIEVIEEPEIMQALIVGLFSVHTAEEARELLLTVVETEREKQALEKERKRQHLIALLDSWLEGDEDDAREQHETLEYLKKALDEDRYSARKLFP